MTRAGLVYTSILSVFILAVLGLPGCMSTPSPEGKPLPQMTFAHVEPLPVNVAAVEVAGQPDPYFEADFVVSPYNAARNYLGRRFRAGGYDGTLRLAVQSAKVTRSYAKSTQPVAGFLEVGGHDVYQVEMVIRLEHIGPSGHVLYGKTLTAKRAMNITEHASIAERERHQLESMEAMFSDLDPEVRRIVFEEMRL